MKVETIFIVNDKKEINWGKIGNVVRGYCDYFFEDPVLIMSNGTLDELTLSFAIEKDNSKDIFIARNVLSWKDLTGDIYTGKYKVFIDNDLPFGIIDVR